VLGPSLRLELPIFDQRQATRAKLRAQLRQAERSLDELAIRVRSDVRSARTRLLASRQIVEFFAQTILPLRERELAATQLQYNAMQLGLLPLLAAKSHQVAANREYIESLRDYWLARTDLERAAGGPLPSAAGEDK
jgi:cobalt-zinc-cadmium efflux system outer membrane protein